MDIKQKKNSLIQLGNRFAYLSELAGAEQSEDLNFERLVRAKVENPWFTLENQKLAFQNWSEALQKDQIDQWLDKFESMNRDKRVGMIFAGNIPMVGLHDLLCVLASGNKAVVKLSSKDKVLMPLVMDLLKEIEPELSDAIEIREETLGSVDAVIATGSNNSTRYFEYYFREVPHIIRKNRNSIAVLQEEDSEEDLKALGGDIFDYFGLGCRNVSKLFIPESFDLDRFFGAIMDRLSLNMHHKYMNNYEYNKTVWLMSNYDLLENGFVVLKEDQSLASPLGTLFYERYASQEDLAVRIEEQKDAIQCVVGNVNWDIAMKFGTSQKPRLWDYADGVNTMNFLQNLN